jgi:putative Ig domain-containing protein/CARDB protein
MSSSGSRFVFVFGLLFLSLLAWAASPDAATLTVTDLGDTGAAGQLRTLITGAAAGDTIVVPAGTITLNAALGQLVLSKNLIIQGAGAGATIVDGARKNRLFFIFSPDLIAPQVAISGVTIRNGQPPEFVGGGILNRGNLTLTNVVVSGNTAKGASPAGSPLPDGGGGIYNGVNSTMTLSRVVVTGNTATRGGGIYNDILGTATLTDVTVSNNQTGVEAGGAGLYNAGTASLSGVTVSGNATDNAGAGIETIGTATLTNVTVSGNAATNGGGIYIADSSLGPALTILTNVTITANTAGLPGTGAGGLFSAGAAPKLTNVIVSGNTTVNCFGPITSLGHNLDSGTTCGFPGTGDLSNADPLLGPLQNNGGFTLTHALLAGSPAIDAGTNTGCPPTDQRGAPFLRPQGLKCDIGAYEVQSGVAPSFTISPASLPAGTMGTAYSQTLTLISTPPSYIPPSPSFGVTLGTPPPGLNLDATGLLHGTPTIDGLFSFTVTANDANGLTASRAYTVTIGQPAAPTLTIEPASLPGGTVGTAYSETLTLVSTPPSYVPPSPSFTVTLGSPPLGLTLDATGLLHGTPTGAGSFDFTVTALDGNGFSASRAYTVTIAQAPTFVILPASLPGGALGTAYSQNLTLDGGSYVPPSPIFGVTAGRLPPGLTLELATGLLHGTLTRDGSFDFTVTAQDANGLSASRAYTVTISQSGAPSADLAVTALSGPSKGTIGGEIKISLAVANQGLVAAGPFEIGVYFSDDPALNTNVTPADVSGLSCAAPAGLGPGRSIRCRGFIGVPASMVPGRTYYLGAIADDLAQVPDQNGANNLRVADTGPIFLTLPDFAGSWSTPPTQTCTGAGPGLRCKLRGTFELVNQGAVPAGASSVVRFYLSNDAVVDGSDTLLKEVSVRTLRAGGTRSIRLSVSLSLGTSASGRFVIAVLDANNAVAETSETNNTIVFGPIP